VIADLDTLLIALYVELTDRVIPALGRRRRGPGRPAEVTDAELVCLAVAQVLRYNDERHWLRAAPTRVGHLFPRLLGQSAYNQRLKDLAPLLEAALRWLAGQTPGSAERLRLLDGTPVGCGQSAVTAKRSCVFGYAGYGYEPSHSRYDWGVKLLLHPPVDGAVVDLDAALGQQFREVAVGQAEAQVPADCNDDHIGWEAEAGEGGSRNWSKARAASCHADSLAAGTPSWRTQQSRRGTSLEWTPSLTRVWRGMRRRLQASRA
jgi:hypothetical protein